MPRTPQKRSKSSSGKKKGPQPTRSSKRPADASITLPSFGKLSFGLTIEAMLKKDKVGSLSFVSEGPASFQRIMSNGCALFEGKTPDEVEGLSFEKFVEEMNSSPEEKELALYAWTALQDVISRLPFDDPLSKAISRLHFLNREFKHGTLLPDLED